MAESDRARWNAKYEGGAGATAEPSPRLVELRSRLPCEGRALDVAGGAGANAIWLAQQGLESTLIDVSDVALARAAERAAAAGVELRTASVDLERESLPVGPWDLILCSHYLQRELIPAFAAALAPGGRLIWIHPTQTNLERHARPSARFLLAPGEARELVTRAGLELELAREGWVGEGAGARHLAQIVAARGRPT